MSILNDREIASEVSRNQMIEPYEPKLVREVSLGSDPHTLQVTPFSYTKGGDEIFKKVISYGQSSYGYDLRCQPDWKIFTNAFGEVVDPKDFKAKAFVESQEASCIIPPNSFVLTVSKEYFRMPKDILGVCVGKSTYARCGVIANVTPLEPGWEGNLTIELSNTTPLPVRVYSGEGICQILFFRGLPCGTNYADRGGKYMGTTGIVLPKL